MAIEMEVKECDMSNLNDEPEYFLEMAKDPMDGKFFIAAVTKRGQPRVSVFEDPEKLLGMVMIIMQQMKQ